MKRKAFTLIELLVVIAIIAILAAILFPVFAQAKAAAKKTSDLSNQKQIATANLLYSGDVDDVMVANGEGLVPSNAGDWTGIQPFTGEGGGYWGPVGAGAGGNAPNSPLGFMDPAASPNWGREMMPYIKSMDMLVSPGSQNDGNAKFAPVRVLPAGITGVPGRTSYAMNGCASGKSQTSIARPAEIIVFQARATTTKEAICLPRRAHFNDGWTGANDADWPALGTNFSKGGNYAYADGHAKFKMRKAVLFREFGFFEWVELRDEQGNYKGWTPPTQVGGMKADPSVPKTAEENWKSSGACDVSQEPWTNP
ncbi:prepilin-type N-terminal cleavage/methylation domain-containing protein [bacterium]|nr:MAG: prepilin-type N-terminal cleavage/methylation domain-containing protein [bacterium]